MINRRSYKIFNICGPVAKKTVSSFWTWRSLHLRVAAGRAQIRRWNSASRFLSPRDVSSPLSAARALYKPCALRKRITTRNSSVVLKSQTRTHNALHTNCGFSTDNTHVSSQIWRVILTDSLGNFLYFLTYLWRACPRTLDNKPSSFARRYPRIWTFAQRRYKTVFRERI